MAKQGVDLSKLSIEELETLVRDAQAEIVARKEAERQRVLQQVRELAGSVGMSVEELLKLEKAAARGAGEVKYRHPENAELIWSGRGKRPQWVTDALGSGKTLEDLAA
ncbi:MAG TPA: H-NS histone family protein [Thermoanaerobaculia bacterium]|nr:H-NS histone family protein [Thermoanaerobaculia bacterium]